MIHDPFYLALHDPRFYEAVIGGAMVVFALIIGGWARYL